MGIFQTGIGLDLGAHAAKAVWIEGSGSRARIKGIASVPRPGPASGGEDIPAIADALRSAGIPTKGVVLGISGRDSMLRYNHVPNIPPWRLKLMIQYEAAEISEKTGDALAWDYGVLPVGVEDGMVVLLGLSKEGLLTDLLRGLEDAGITVRAACPTSIALASAFRFFGAYDEDETILLADVGAETLNMVILQGGMLLFARSVSFGGRMFTEALASAAGGEFEKAERFKVERGAIHRPGGQAPSGTGEAAGLALRGPAGQLLSIIQSGVDFSRAQLKMRDLAVDRVVLSGGGARLGGLVDYLGASLGKPVDVFDPFRETGGPHDALEYASALGLAVGAFDRRAFQLNLLPETYKKRREFRDRTLFLYATAGVLVLYLLLVVVRGLAFRSVAMGQRTDLVSTRNSLERIHGQYRKNQLENLDTKNRLERWHEEALANGFTSYVLDFLGSNLADGIVLRELRLEKETAADKDGKETGRVRTRYVIMLRLTADNSNRKAVEMARALKSAIEGNARVSKVDFSNPRETGNDYDFTLEVHPNLEGFEMGE